MQSHYIEIIEESSPKNALDLPVSSWFTEAGITAEGRCWVTPSEDFFEQWLTDDKISGHLEMLGFEMAFDGRSVGSWSEFIFYCPPNMGTQL